MAGLVRLRPSGFAETGGDRVRAAVCTGSGASLLTHVSGQANELILINPLDLTITDFKQDQAFTGAVSR